MNNLEKFYDKKELYDKVQCHDYVDLIDIYGSRESVEIKLTTRIKDKLKENHRQKIMTIIESFIRESKKDIEGQIRANLRRDMEKANDQVINDLNLKGKILEKEER